MAASLSEAELEAIKWDEAVIELYPQVSWQTLSLPSDHIDLLALSTHFSSPSINIFPLSPLVPTISTTYSFPSYFHESLSSLLSLLFSLLFLLSQLKEFEAVCDRATIRFPVDHIQSAKTELSAEAVTYAFGPDFVAKHHALKAKR